MTATTAPRRRATTLAAITLGLAVAIAPALADARAGSGKSSGSRGSQTYQAPPTTSTAPRPAAPMERTAAPQQVRPQPAMTSPAAQARPGGLFGGGFGGALLGGLIGAGLVGLLFGHGLFGGMAGIGSILGLLMQAALIGGLIWLAVAFFRRRQQPAPAGMGHARTGLGGPMGGNSLGGNPLGSGPAGSGPMGSGPMGGFDARAPGMGGGAPTGPARPAPTPIQIREGDYASFERLLADVQDAWSRGDVGAMRALMTAEMAGYFVEEMNANTARGVQNRTERVRLVQGDLAEAWREGGEEYATVALRFAHVDYSVDASGRVVEGSPDREVEATEVWTFVRPVGGSWMLSAIQQAG
ncbi:MAG: Tim44 domain-containing protein [Rhodospirillales bacterium]